MRTLFRLQVILLALLAATGIGVSFAEDTEALSTGTWRSDTMSTSGSWSADLARQGDNLSGTFSLTNSPIENGEVTGMITDGSSITFGVLDRRAVGPQANRNAITFTGTLHGSSIKGAYTTAFGDTGSWEGTLEPR